MRLTDGYLLACRLMKEHGLHGWAFGFDNSKRRAGRCNYTRKRITLSKSITSLNDEVRVRDTILHEIAHALVGPGHNHDWIWRAKAREIGCSGERCHNHETPQGDWQANCSCCGKLFTKLRKPRATKACGACCRRYNNGRFTADFLLVYTFRGGLELAACLKQEDTI